jgi:tRNA(Ile)-lysidine synthetase-like protein
MGVFMELKLDLSKSHTYILSVSGGVDSMSLFHYLMTHQYNFVAVHFDHQKRESSKLDGELIESLCQKYQIPYHYIKLSIKSGNFQEAARKERYKHLEEIAVSHHTTYILTAHHADDQLETILMKLIRGSNLLGYSGMRGMVTLNGFTYIKPLLSYTKEDLYTYAKEHDVPYLEDESNASDDYLRNRIRHHVTPLLKKENDLVAHVESFSTQAFNASNFIRSVSKQFLNNETSFKLSEFITLHKAVQSDVLSYILEQFNVSRSYQKITEMLRQLTGEKPNVSISLSKDYVMVRSYDIVKVISKKLKKEVSLNDCLTIYHNNDGIPNNSIELCYNELDFPLIVRNREKGDLLSFTFGHKKLKVFLIEKKVPLHERSNLKIVVDQKGRILWIPGLYINQTLGNTHKIYLSMKE